MQLPSPQRLVLITSAEKLGTGYFITDNIVLTASHVVRGVKDTLFSVRVHEGEPIWRENCPVIWSDEILDAALIKVSPPLSAGAVPVILSDQSPAMNLTWNSAGYPDASVGAEGERTSAGLEGTLYSVGGSGQGPRYLDLGVKDPPLMKDWEGVSGAPIFVGKELVGIVRSASFVGNRLKGVPSKALLQDIGFLRAIQPTWLDLPSSGPWLLALLSETTEKGFSDGVSASLVRLAKKLGQPDHAIAKRVVSVTDVFQTPGHWLQFVEALCAAPLMIADVTNFEPGVMLALGVRAVVRRGITIASTAKRLDEVELSSLPFNIQETKLISRYNAGYDSNNPKHPVNIVSIILLNGIKEINSKLTYLDLPVYDAVRCARPEIGKEELEALLVLFSFHDKYASNYSKIENVILNVLSELTIVRIRDMDSPRLVGQALYENIRWARSCVVDWTHWRPNVFFELGVRLACTNSEPVSLLEDPDTTPPKSPDGLELTQKQSLKRLFAPICYTLTDPEGTLAQALENHKKLRALPEDDAPPTRSQDQIPFSGTFRIAEKAFDYSQERVTMSSPQELLRSSVVAMFGTDEQKKAQTSILFSANTEFKSELRRSARERWIAAWYYLRNRYEDQVKHDPRLQDELEELSESLFQVVRNDAGDPSIAKLLKAVQDLIVPPVNPEED